MNAEEGDFDFNRSSIGGGNPFNQSRPSLNGTLGPGFGGGLSDGGGLGDYRDGAWDEDDDRGFGFEEEELGVGDQALPPAGAGLAGRNLPEEPRALSVHMEPALANSPIVQRQNETQAVKQQDERKGLLQPAAAQAQKPPVAAQARPQQQPQRPKQPVDLAEAEWLRWRNINIFLLMLTIFLTIIFLQVLA